jgi:hypothetical protein
LCGISRKAAERALPPAGLEAQVPQPALYWPG